MTTISIVDVTGRDGFQNIGEPILTSDKVKIIKSIIDAGIEKLEIASFVSPRWLPQMRDAVSVVNEIDSYRRTLSRKVELIALVPNLKGAIRGSETQVDSFVYPISVSERHNKENVNRTHAESLDELKEILSSTSKPITVGLATAFGSPYTDEVITADDVIDLALRVSNLGVSKITLADTMGNGNPRIVEQILRKAKQYLNIKEIALHLHNTFGFALANTLTALTYGIYEFESATGGLGGCPFAKGAAGNIATEDLVNFLVSMQYHTSVDINQLMSSVSLLDKIIPNMVNSNYYRFEKGKEGKNASV